MRIASLPFSPMRLRRLGAWLRQVRFEVPSWSCLAVVLWQGNCTFSRESGDRYVWFLELRAARWLPGTPQIMLVQWSLRFPFRRRRSPALIPIWRAAFRRRAPHFHLPLPVISATAPGLFAARRVWCRTSSFRNTHFHFPVGVDDSAMVPGVFSAPPGSGEGFHSRHPDAADELDFFRALLYRQVYSYWLK